MGRAVLTASGWETDPPLLDNASATGSAVEWAGGPGVFRCAGTFGGATVTLQFLNANASTWTAVGDDTTLTAAGAGYFTLPPCQIRALVAGGTPSALYAKATPVK